MMFWSVIIGLVAGWIAAKMSGGVESIYWGNLTVGLMGSIAGGFLLRMFITGLPGAFANIIASIVGAVVAIGILKMIAHRKTTD